MKTQIEIDQCPQTQSLSALQYPHPQDCVVRDGEALVTITRPGLFAVDINGQMDDQDTGRLPGGHHAGYYQVLVIT